MYIADFFQFIHENRDLISDVGIIPLTENWEPGTFDAAKTTTMEDVEKMVQAGRPGGEVEFIPAGLSYAMKKPRSFFRKSPRSEVLLLAGVHPNCESMTLLISDGKTYRGINHYLKKPFTRGGRGPGRPDQEDRAEAGPPGPEEVLPAACAGGC